MGEKRMKVKQQKTCFIAKPNCFYVNKIKFKNIFAIFSIYKLYIF